MSFVLGMGTKPFVFSGKVAPARDERYLGCAAGAAALDPVRIGSSSVFFKECFYAFVESLLADRSGMAA